MIKQGEVKRGDILFNTIAGKVGIVTRVDHCFDVNFNGRYDILHIDYADGFEHEIIYVSCDNFDFIKVETVSPRATACSIRQAFEQMRLEKEYEKEKEKMETGFTIKKINKVDKIIFNDPATIVYMKDGSRYVTKAYKEDFDKEKCLALALLKAFGISYLDLQRLIKSATVQEKKLPKNVVSKKHSQPITGSNVFMEQKKPVEKKKRAGRVEVTELRNGYTIHRGKRRGVGQKLQQGDMVLVRLCKVYDWEELEVVRDLIGRPLMVDYIGEHSLRVKLPEQKRTYEFSRNEVDRI